MTPAKFKIHADLAADLGLKVIELRKVKENSNFKRKPEAAAEFTRNHYNRADKNAVFVRYANFSATNNETGSEVFLKPETLVYVCQYTQ